MATQLEIKKIKVKDLPAVAAQMIDGAPAGSYIAITKHRAEALAKNPMASPDDIGLLLAYEADELVGYFGIMPIVLQHKGHTFKSHWFTTWSAASHMVGKGVGSALLQAALALKLDFLIVGSGPARHVCEKFGFKTLPPLDIAWLDFRVVGQKNPLAYGLRGWRKFLHLFGRKVEIEPALKKVGGWFDRLLGDWMKRTMLRRLSSVSTLALVGYEIERMAAVDVNGFAETVRGSKAFLSRDWTVINWMISYPWVLQPGQSASEHLDYYFTDVRPEFKNIVWVVKKDQKPYGTIVFQVSKINQIRVVRVLDVDLADAQLVLPLAIRLAKDLDADRIEMNANYARSLKSSLVYQTRERVYQYFPAGAGSPLDEAAQSLALDFSDGDMAFT